MTIDIQASTEDGRRLSVTINDLLELGPIIFFEQFIAPKPADLWLGRCDQLAFEDEFVAIVLLPQLGLLREARG